ncbi:uncharacterized protein LOC108287141 [Cebus imitator]|uniref:uncharacterized protein LOC108287141 n=1 Tax=Cebus imitator TaxID=2715852 RepID=UPI0018970B63|nr:uncharacterized protein LOC108287141 [Cebus imitator]
MDRRTCGCSTFSRRSEKGRSGMEQTAGSDRASDLGQEQSLPQTSWVTANAQTSGTDRGRAWGCSPLCRCPETGEGPCQVLLDLLLDFLLLLDLPCHLALGLLSLQNFMSPCVLSFVPCYQMRSPRECCNVITDTRIGAALSLNKAMYPDHSESVPATGSRRSGQMKSHGMAGEPLQGCRALCGQSCCRQAAMEPCQGSSASRGWQ